jgi:leucyl-tRNA synthetase
MAYEHKEIERKWREEWRRRGTYRVANDTSRPKYYVLDMFPYPSGAGLHVGHPLGYIASDIVSRYKRHCGFNVLHPMGYDSFGLPAEQYAIQTGQHPAKTTEVNIKRYREQLDNIGFCFDWDREVRTSDPAFYKWTQWVFIQLFHSWYNAEAGRAEPISTLIGRFEAFGFSGIDRRTLTGDEDMEAPTFTAEEWKAFSEAQQEAVLQHFRLAYRSEAWVNWCPALGTVLANDEVKDGVSERGGHPVERKRMPQWSLRITAYAQRLLDGLDQLDWSESIKEAQRNWIGRSEGALVKFPVVGSDEVVEVFTTRPDTLFGVTFITLAPEHVLVDKLVTDERRAEVMGYVAEAKNRSERERQADVKRVSGAFTGAYVKHPFTGQDVPVWVGDYVLVGYATGAVMAVPGGDQRDWNFARHFDLPIIAVTEGANITKEADERKDATLTNSGFLDGLKVPQAITRAIQELENLGRGEGRINYRLRDAAFGRQRYWGEPIPVYYANGLPRTLPEERLPLELPAVDKFLPTEDGEPPLARAADWTYNGHPLETTTMPGWAGSSWYFLRYMDPGNAEHFASPAAINYWHQVDLYVGGSEHATGHLLYFRFWTKFLFDRGWLPFEEPAKKLVNQGMIQGISMMARVTVDRSSGTERYLMLSKDKRDTPGSFDRNYLIDQVVFRDGRYFIDEDGAARTRAKEATFREFHLDAPVVELTPVVEKMSKSKFNVVNPDDIIECYGADTLRLYEMFLGPVEQSKPWDTNGIEGTYRFLRKFWNLFHVSTEASAKAGGAEGATPGQAWSDNALVVTDEAPTKPELKILHATLKKVTEDIEKMSFNTSVAQFMIAVNELGALKCSKRSILEPLTIALAPFAPHITEELWQKLGHAGSVTTASWPKWSAEHLVEDSFSYPISFNGKTRLQLEFPIALDPKGVEEQVLANPEVQARLEGKAPKKVIVVPKRIVNIVV